MTVAAADTPGIGIVLQRGATISGSVVNDEDGQGITGAYVHLCSTAAHDYYDGDCYYVSSVAAGPDGSFQFASVQPGEYRLRAYTSSGSDWLPGWYGGGSGSTLTVAEASDTPDVDLVLTRGARVSGTITGAGATGQPSVPVPDARVTLYRASYDYAIASDSTDASGGYTFSQLEAGTYHVAVQPASASPWMSEWIQDAATRAGATEIVVTAGQALTGQDVELARGGTVEGTVTGGGEPVPYVTVGIYDAATGDRTMSVATGTDGSYRVGGLDTGEYLVRFNPSDRSGNWLREWNADRRTKLTADPIPVQVGQVSTVDAQLSAGAEIRGTVVGGDVGLDDVSIGVYRAEDGTYVGGSSTNASGEYVVSGLPSGTYTVSATPYGDGDYAAQWYSGKATQESADTVTVAVGQQEVTDFTLAPGGSISGTVSGPLGPVAETDVTACSEQGCRSDATSWDGTYRITGLAEGSYTVQFGDWYGTLAQEWYDDAPVEAEADLVPVLSGAAVEGIDAVLAERGRLMGKMTDEFGDGIWGQVVACSTGSEGGDDCQWTSSTARGNWAMALPAGKYRVQFTADGFASEWYPSAAAEADAQLITVTASSEQRLDAELVAQVRPDGGAVTVTITGDAGSGVAPLADTLVELVPVGSDEPEISRWTGPDGIAGFGSVAPGSYIMSVWNQPDWVHRYLGGDGTLAQATRIDVVAGGAIDAGTLQLERSTSIAGTITSGSQPVDYVAVRAYGLDGDVVASGYTTYRGEYLIPGLVAGQYRLFVDASRAPGNLASRWVGGGSDPSSAQVIDLAPGEQLTGTDVELVGASRIAGTVTAAGGGELLRRILVELYSVDAAGGELVDTDFTDAEGGFSFGHLTSGEYRVRAGGLELSCDPGILGCATPQPSAEAPVWQPVWFAQADTYASASPVPLGAGQRLLDVDVALPAAETGVRVSIGGPSLVTAGTTVVLSGTTTSRPADGVVAVQSKVGDAWSDIATAVVGGQSWSASVVAPGSGTVTYRAVMRQGATELAVSGEKLVTVVPVATVPGRPGTPTLVGLGDGQVRLAWTAAPAGGSVTTGYTVTAAPGGASCTAAGLSCTVTGLANGTAYTFTAVATNSYGDGPVSTPSASFTPRTVPGAPAQPLAVAGTDGHVTVHWAAPTSTGGSAISGFTVTADPGGQTCSTTSALSCAVAGLANATPYTFTVRASNVAGAGPASPVSVAVSPRPAVAGAGSVSGTVRLDGNPVGADQVWISIWNDSRSSVTSTDASGSYAFQGLVPGTYSLQASPLVAGISGFTGQVLVEENQNTLRDVPLQAIPDAVPPPASVTLTDVAGRALPVDSDEIPRVGQTVSTILFEVEACVDASASYTAEDWYDGATSGPMAQTAPGSGRYAADVDISALSGEVHIIATIVCPNAPSSPQEVAFDIYIDPSGIVVDQHGAPIKGATATLVRSDSASGPFTVVPSGSAIMSERNRTNPGITGKDGAFSWDVIEGYYKVLVTADGCDPGSSDVLAIPPEALGLVVTLRCGLPGAPGKPTAAAGDTGAVIMWTAPAEDVGAGVTGYTVTASPGGQTCTTAALSCTVAGLTNGVAYTFAVVAKSGVGSGPASDASNAVTPFGLPGSPGALTATAGDGSVALGWAAPASDGGSPITGYQVTVTPGSVVTATGTGVTVSGLANGTAYSFTVAAMNARGVGQVAGPVTASPIAPPPPPGPPAPPSPPPPGPPSPPPAPQKAPTSLTLTSSPTKGTLTTAITLRATGLPGTATGSVTFSDLGHVLGVVPVSNGSSRITTKSIFGGTQTITASYSGDAVYLGAQATTVVRITDKGRPSITAPKANKSAATPTITFRAKDAGGVKAVQIRYRLSAPGRTKLGKWISAGRVSGTDRSWQKVGGFTPATKVCYQVKALDYAGRTSAWKGKCTTVR